MDDKKITPALGAIILFVVVISTVGLFFLCAPASGKSFLFYFNMCYSVLLELILFGYINFVRLGRKSSSIALYSITGVLSVYYIIVGIILMSLSWLIPVKLYISIIVLATLSWVVIVALIALVDSKHKNDIETTKEKNRKLMNHK